MRKLYNRVARRITKGARRIKKGLWVYIPVMAAMQSKDDRKKSIEAKRERKRLKKEASEFPHQFPKSQTSLHPYL